MNQSRDKTCYYCEREYGSVPKINGKPLIRSKDHIIPISKGGSNRADNILYCCVACNKMKGDLLLEELAEKISGFISKTKKTRTYYTTVLGNVEKLIRSIAPIKGQLVKSAVSKKGNTRPQKLPPDQLLPFLSEDWQKRFNKQ